MNRIRRVCAKALIWLFFFGALLPLRRKSPLGFFEAAMDKNATSYSYYVVRKRTALEACPAARETRGDFVDDLKALWIAERRTEWLGLLTWIPLLAWFFRKKNEVDADVDPNIYAMF